MSTIEAIAGFQPGVTKQNLRVALAVQGREINEIQMAWLFACIIAISGVVSPSAMVMAQDAPVVATPVVEQSPAPSPPAEGEEKEEAAEDSVVGVGTPASTEEGDGAMTRSSLVAPAAISGSFSISNLSYDHATSSVSVQLSVLAGFTAETGDHLVLEWWLEHGTISVDPSNATVSLGGSNTATLSDVSPGIMHLIFDGDYAVGTVDQAISFTLPVVDIFEECGPDTSGYTQRSEINLSVKVDNSASSFRWTVAEGDSCPATSEPFIDWAGLYIFESILEVEIGVPNPTAGGETVTLTYPASLITVQPGTYDVELEDSTNGDYHVVGQAVVETGLITITFYEMDASLDWYHYELLEIPFTFNLSCEASGEVEIMPEFSVILVGSPGGEFTERVSGALCNAAPMTKTGVWISDTEIEWTIDTGHIFGSGEIYDPMWSSGPTLSCDEPTAPVIETVYPEDVGDLSLYIDCDEDRFYMEFWNTDYARFTITLTTTISGDRTSYLNCVEASSFGDGSAEVYAVAQNFGLGDEACYELFPEGGGDFITKSVDKDVVESGETVTFTIEVETTSDDWGSIELTDALPAGFNLDPTSVECSVEPVEFEGEDCYEISDNVITAQALPFHGDGVYMAPAVITLKFSGTVTGEPGAIITNEACSERLPWTGGIVYRAASVGDPTIPGGGVICASASVQIPSPPVTETPTPTGTVTPDPTATTVPGTPVATPSATSGVDPADPDPTEQPVTGLPSTGQGTNGVSPALMVLLSAASMLLIATGLRLRSDTR